MQHTTCDRCGAKTDGPGATIGESVVLGQFEHDQWYSKSRSKSAVLGVKIQITAPDNEDGVDLCTACRVETVILALRTRIIRDNHGLIRSLEMSSKSVRDVVALLSDDDDVGAGPDGPGDDTVRS